MSKKSNIGIIIVKTIKVIFCLPFLLFGIFIFYKVLWPQIQEMPNIKWPDFLIISIFCIVFTGVGFVMPLLAVFRKEKEKPQIEPVTSSKITHQDLIEINKDWGDNAISNDNIGHKIMIVFALVWNVIAYSISFAVLSEALPKRDYKAMLVLLFPAVGLILIFMAIKFYLQKVRFGNSEFIMDPFPGCIGGEVAGYIDLN
ncbi:MAG: hypothetical protein MK193_06050, partial [Lentisphaeria bacterium]|nr:hypothetical protein [Lentisphaeria bacterium]